MDNVFTNPNGKNININKSRKLNILYPDYKLHPIIAEYVQVTENEEYVFSYLELRNGKLVPCFTELVFLDGEWYKNPFHKEYEEYKFKSFDEELSNDIIVQMPQQLHFRISLGPSSKFYDLEPVESESLTSKVDNIEESEKVPNYLYMVLIANDGDSYIDKHLDGKEYNFDFTFPVFGLPINVKHEAYSTDSKSDINSDVEYQQNEYSKEELPISVRREVVDFLKRDTSEKFDIRDLPIFEYTTQNGEEYSICFVSCSNLDLFNEIYKSQNVLTDISAERSFLYDNDLESGLHYEIPLTITLSGNEIKTNGVRHNNKIPSKD